MAVRLALARWKMWRGEASNDGREGAMIWVILVVLFVVLLGLLMFMRRGRAA
jgi:hypothetical protein